MAMLLYVTAVTGNYPNGQFINQALLTYNCAVSDDVKASDFSVKGREITGVKVDNNAVYLFLDNIREPAASLFPPKPALPEKSSKNEISGPPRDMPPTKLLPIQVEVTQISSIFSADGSEIPSDGKGHISDRIIEPVVDQFIQGVFCDLPYNLFIPKDVMMGEKYPLVMFIHDAGPCGSDPKITLAQGYGAIGFASPEWQKDHPCFVLAPQIDRHVHLTNDDSTCSKEIYDIKALLDYIAENYPIDASRIYATGQSMGCMASCELNALYPDYFAASLLVAGQWSAQRVANAYKNNKYWILVSEHDLKAFPGMNAVTDAIEATGVNVARYHWDGSEDPEVLTKYARSAMIENKDVNVHYTVFNGSSVVPKWEDDNPGTNHVNTWPVAYSIKGLKEWLFKQRK